MPKNNSQNLPKHIAIIMDGNRRWAKEHALASVIKGHEYVVNHVIEILVDECIRAGIPYLTLWAFSTENWERDQEEVADIMNLFRQAFAKQSEALHKKGVRLNTIGDMNRFPEDIQAGARHWQEISKNNQKITVTFALNYGGRNEILRAIRSLKPEELATLTEEQFSAKLDTQGLPDPDLVIRTGGELRLSGFMPWQAVYAEYYFPKVLMPDFTAAEFRKALEEYSDRNRRFGS